MAKIIDSVGAGVALTQAQHDSNLESLHGVNKAVVAATYTVDIDDQGETIEFNRAGGIAVTLDDITTIQTAAHTSDFMVILLNVGSGDVVITPDTSDSFNTGDSTITLGTDDCIVLQTDSTGAIWNVITETLNTLTGKTLTAPVIDAVYDANGNELLEFGTTASALNNIKITNRATTVYPTISAEGESDIGISCIDSNGNNLLLMLSASGADSYLRTSNGTSNVAIQADSPTRANIDIALTPKGTGVVDIAQGELEVGSTPVYGLVVLDTPVELESGTSAVGTWTKHDMSGGTGSAAATAGASKAILRVHTTVARSIAGNSSSEVYVQKNGIGGAADKSNMVCSCMITFDVNDATSATAKSTSEFVVNLDVGSDFEFQFATDTSGSYDIYLVGYYV